MQAYIQSENLKDQNIYIRSPKQLNLSRATLWKSINPLYELSDLRDYWHETFKKHFTEDPGLHATLTYQSLHISNNNDYIGILGSQLDYIISYGNKVFLTFTKKTKTSFDYKDKTFDNSELAVITIRKTTYAYYQNQLETL